MTARILDGRAIAAQIHEEAARDAARFRLSHGRSPRLVVFVAGEDPASTVYVRNKTIAAAAAGIDAQTVELPESVSTDDLLALVGRADNDDATDGILVQMPLPVGVDGRRVLDAVAPEKDVDGFHPINVGLLQQGRPRFVSCTPAGILELLIRSGIPVSGRRAVIIGRSDIVGKPMAALLLAGNATVTITHSKTRDLPAVCREAEILVAAVGRAGLVTAEFVRDGAVVIDVGITRTAEGLRGDVDFDAVKEKASAITPVPGGVGPLTVAMLLRNTVAAAQGRAGGG
jgi:methylenetetrahydrofolate dehydrogenase (NADP+) / methenyltetrahydrofolate cyclohydrolase